MEYTECFKNEVRNDIIGKMNYLNNIAVLLIFFNRPSKIQEVFDAVKQAKPSRLYLYQDGIRNEKDKEAVFDCRRIVEKINWKCTVYKLYQDRNYGCDPSEYIAQKWMFSHEETGIVLEDDDVPSQSFFPFCIELLQKYKDDNRLAIICGMNNYDVSNDIAESYFFSKHGSIWGWASWKRFIDLWDPQYTWLNNEKMYKKIFDYCDETINFKQIKTNAKNHSDSGKAYYESIMFAAAATNNMLNIVPKYNMISNIGVDAESTHSVSDVRLLCKRTQKLLYKKRYEINFPLIHPQSIVQNKTYDKKFIYHKYQKLWDSIEVAIRKLVFKH